ncbi:glycoside hydrolase family 3 N-terminal domain-containing protein [Methylovirgula sp. 4M-Z18]|uniref:glycoside hydrolase family 3 N-terminal domain-containing protein n=1 Tax=Methylovirgula sp. 4M-Z18 TaxID=2293567 RepID=UPI000E2FE0F3|nr:glycoside hydrolase family 3 N-terminal domain-containing protein [Methylovirgula sp. 4M-Z18]RFB75647.1 beta-glucosidase [Methylovirgula sp. 4M-Z18]
MMESSGTTRIEQLLSQMTLEEKIGQLVMLSGDLVKTGPTSASVTHEAIVGGKIGSLLNLWGPERVRDVQRLAVEESRLKIPMFFGLDVLRGLSTIFPIPFGEGAAFDPKLWEATARVAAEECAVFGVDITFAPMIDVARDPRWGRIQEGPGEDALVGARMAEAKVRGYQGPRLADAGSIAATIKHLAAYGTVRAGREYASVDISERSLHEVYLPPFRAGVAAGVAAIMPAFTDLNGTPMTAHVAILRDIVRREWGFSGVMISDYSAVAELMVHGIAADQTEAAALALNAGVDIDMMGGGAYTDGLPQALKRGLVTMETIDSSVRRVLELKEKLGLFEDPYRRCGSAEAVAAKSAQRSRHGLAREAARRSIVLLTNKDDTLPLRDSTGVLAVIGPLADGKGEAQQDTAGKNPVVFEWLRDALPQTRVAFAPGCEIERGHKKALADARVLARQCDAVVLCLGETIGMSGEASSRGRPDLPHAQQELARAVLAQKKPVIVLLFSGRPLVLPDWLVEKAKAILAVWFLGDGAGTAIADVLSGRFNPSGRLTMSWPVDVGQIPIYFAERPTGRPPVPAEHYSSKYLDMPNEPRFAFGHGLSYSQFELSGLRTSRQAVRAGEALDVTVDVSNKGPQAGEQTLFLFIRDLASSVTRPALELKDFRKITLAAGESGALNFHLTTDDLRFLDRDLQPKLEPGAFDILVGASAEASGLLRTRIEVLG